MKARIDELKDTLIEVRKIQISPETPLVNTLEFVKDELRSLKETSDYIEIKIRDEEKGKIVLNEKEIIDFFEQILKAKDEKLLINK
jgi:hypothetical protein